MTSSAPILSARHVHRSYGDLEVLRDLSFEVGGPQLVGILGPAGSGKTSLLDLLEGLAEPSRGEIALFGKPLLPGAYPRQRVGVVLQREFLPEQICVAEYADLFSAMCGVPGGASRILREAELEASAKVRVDALSTLQAQNLFIASALVHDPELLFLDEPSFGVGSEAKVALGEKLRSLSRQRTVVLSTDDLSEAEKICDFCLFLSQGRLCVAAPKAEILSSMPGRSLADSFLHLCSPRSARQGQCA
ncbi:MAG TPA: ABC transporter ATP-binding protein [Polyangiaceae bacterium]|nr:ABC transporter ATP-binding protein [Polyangiaceae bacterium]